MGADMFKGIQRRKRGRIPKDQESADRRRDGRTDGKTTKGWKGKVCKNQRTKKITKIKPETTPRTTLRDNISDNTKG